MVTSTHSPTHPDDEMADAEAVRALADLALDCARDKVSSDELARAVRRHLARAEDEVLHDALDQARGLADGAFGVLREAVHEAAANVLVRRAGSPDLEISAFAIPVFVRSTGGLRQEAGFQDQDAYDALLASLAGAGLESGQAKLVLIRHWYDLAEMHRLGYGRLHELAREVGQALGEKKPRPMPALERSMSGWRQAPFAPTDNALELRFLLGFARKRADDPFYAVPRAAAAADAYFERRLERFRAWTGDAAPLVRRLLAPGGAGVEVHFLYQDLFHGALAQAEAEWLVMQLVADVNAACGQAGIAPGATRASVELVADEAGGALRIAVHGPDGAWLAGADMPLDPDADLAAEVADLDDALAAVGVPPLERA